MFPERYLFFLVQSGKIQNRIQRTFQLPENIRIRAFLCAGYLVRAGECLYLFPERLHPGQSLGFR